MDIVNLAATVVDKDLGIGEDMAGAKNGVSWAMTTAISYLRKCKEHVESLTERIRIELAAISTSIAKEGARFQEVRRADRTRRKDEEFADPGREGPRRLARFARHP